MNTKNSKREKKNLKMKQHKWSINLNQSKMSKKKICRNYMMKKSKNYFKIGRKENRSKCTTDLQMN